MTQIIPLEAIPNQSFTIRLDDRRYELSFYYCLNIMACDVIRDGETIVTGSRCVAGVPLLPFEYFEQGAGNFFFQTENDNLPEYTRFGDTQVLLYFTDSELQELRNGS